MRDNESGAYFVSRRTSKRGGAGKSHAVGVLIVVLLILSAGICLLVLFLPRSEKAAQVSGGASTGFDGATFYALATSKTTERDTALAAAQYAAERGGAGYIHNDGEYRVVAAMYERESDVKTLTAVNADSHYFEIAFPKTACDAALKAMYGYLTGEWFSVVSTAATQLDKGNITEAAAEHAVLSATAQLTKLAYRASSEPIAAAVTACVYDKPQARTTLSYIRYFQARMLFDVHALT